MRLPPAMILLVLVAASVSLADDASIEWTPERRLSWDDFRGAVPGGADAERVATTASSIAWSYAYEIEWSRSSCAFSIVRLDTAARFDPDRSWVRPGHRTAEVLEHEQGHFDIAQQFNQKLRVATRNLIGSVQECNGQSERRATRNAEREISRLVGSVYDKIWQQYTSAQDAYDRETVHGVDRRAQARWTRSIATDLEKRGH